MRTLLTNIYKVTRIYSAYGKVATMSTNSVANLVDDFWKFRLDYKPEFGISKGMIPTKPRLDDYTLESYAKRLDYATSMLENIKKVDVANLNENEFVSHQMLKYYMEMVIDGEKFQSYLQPFSALEGNDYMFLRYTQSKLPFSTKEDYEFYLQLLELLPTQTNQMIQLMQEGVNKGIVRSKVVMFPAAVKRLEGILSTPAEDSRFFTPFKDMPKEISDHDRSQLLDRAKKIIDGGVKKSFKDALDFITEKYVPNTGASVSVDQMAGGPQGRYQAMLKFYCDTDMSPEEIHSIGKDEVSKVQDRIRNVLSSAGFSGTMQEFRDYLDASPDQWCTSEEDMLRQTESILEARIAPHLPNHFSHVPKHPYDLKFEKGSASIAKAFYTNGSADGKVNGVIVLDGAALKTLPKYEMPVLIAHEGNPGHHLQAAYVIDQPDIPMFRKYKDERLYFEIPSNFPTNAAYTEGWGLYSEQLGYEMGIYEDTAEEFGYLISDLARCGRVVADTGLHAMGWSLQQAATYLTQHTCMTQTVIEYELKRYILGPGQACCYKLGHIRMLKLREKCQNELGDMFDIKEFHDVCLSCGQVPLDILEMIVDRYIARKKAA